MTIIIVMVKTLKINYFYILFINGSYLYKCEIKKKYWIFLNFGKIKICHDFNSGIAKIWCNETHNKIILLFNIIDTFRKIIFYRNVV